jgi:hypothetical protein
MQGFVRPGPTQMDAGFPYAVNRVTERQRTAIAVQAEATNGPELGQQAQPAGTQSRYLVNVQTDGTQWPGDVDYTDRRESNRSWYGGLYPAIPQGGLDLESKRRDLGGMPGSININPQTPGGPVESNTVENFTLYGQVLRLVRPNVSATGPVIGGRDYRQVLTGQISQTMVDTPLTVDSMRLFLMNK